MSGKVLGNWIAKVLFWKPQFALMVNEKTLSSSDPASFEVPVQLIVKQQFRRRP
jgi:hypothetical protein